jgi:hypothetical protein
MFANAVGWTTPMPAAITETLSTLPKLMSVLASNTTPVLPFTLVTGPLPMLSAAC